MGGKRNRNWIRKQENMPQATTTQNLIEDIEICCVKCMWKYAKYQFNSLGDILKFGREVVLLFCLILKWAIACVYTHTHIHIHNQTYTFSVSMHMCVYIHV